MDYLIDQSGYQSSQDKRRNKGNKDHFGLNYARGERNGMCKLTDHEVTLMLDHRDNCQIEINEIDKEMEKLKARRLQLKKVMAKRYIADMFEISESHCHRIFNGESR